MVEEFNFLRDGLGDSSLFARSHPLLNFAYFGFVIGVTMFSTHPLFLAVSFLTSWCYSVVLRGKSALKLNLRILLPCIVIMTLINTLNVHNGVTVLFYLNGNRITLEAIIYGFVSSILLSSVIIWFSCFGIIVSSDKFIYLFGRIAPSTALTLSMIMRYIPLLQNRFREVSAAQRCMGRGIKGASLISRLRQLAKELSILIAWSLEASIESSDSMEARGYGLKGRSSFHLFHLSGRDKLLLLMLCILGTTAAFACVGGSTSIYYYPTVTMPPISPVQAISLPAYAILMLLPVAMDLKEAHKWNS